MPQKSPQYPALERQLRWAKSWIKATLALVLDWLTESNSINMRTLPVLRSVRAGSSNPAMKPSSIQNGKNNVMHRLAIPFRFLKDLLKLLEYMNHRAVEESRFPWLLCRRRQGLKVARQQSSLPASIHQSRTK